MKRYRSGSKQAAPARPVSCEELGVPPEKAVLGKTPKSGVLSPESSKAFVAQGLDAVVPIVEPFVHGEDQEDHRADADGTGERSIHRPTQDMRGILRPAEAEGYQIT
jgi:hypothetical protein